MRYIVAVYQNGVRTLETVLADKVSVDPHGTVFFYDDEVATKDESDLCVAVFPAPWSIVGYGPEL